MVSWSGFYGDSQGSNGSYELLSGRSPQRYHLSRIFRKKGMRRYAEILSTILTDSTPATTAGVALSQKTAVRNTTSNVQGGVQAVAAEQLMHLNINPDKDDLSANTARAIVAADVTEMQEEILHLDDDAGHGDRIMRAPSEGSGAISYPVDGSGNGGGGKQF